MGGTCQNTTDIKDHFNDYLFATDIDAGPVAVASLLSWLIASVAVAAGIGGGGLLVPLYYVALDIQQVRAAAISKGTIFGVAVGNFFFTCRERHPESECNRPLIDYPTAIFMQGGELLGVVVGVMLNLLLPEIAIITLSALVLGFNSYKTLHKAVTLAQAETKAIAKQEEGTKTITAETDSSTLSTTTPQAAPSPSSSGNRKHDDCESALNVLPEMVLSAPERLPVAVSSTGMNALVVLRQQDGTVIDRAPKVHVDVSREVNVIQSDCAVDKSNGAVDLMSFPPPAHPGSEQHICAQLGCTRVRPGSWLKLQRHKDDASQNHVQNDAAFITALGQQILAERAQAFPCWAWMLLSLMGSFFIVHSLIIAKAVDLNMNPCRLSYWLVYLMPVFFYGMVITYMAHRNIRMCQQMREAGLKIVKGDINWTPQRVTMLIPASIGAGVAAGLLGIGGGMILGPIFVALDFLPQVGTATTGFMILFTAMGGSVKYLTIGKLPWRHFLWFGTIGIVGGQTGQQVVKKIILRTGRPSYVVFILGGIIGFAVIIMTTFGGMRVVQDINCGVNVWKPHLEQFSCV